jgi:nitroreductase
LRFLIPDVHQQMLSELRWPGLDDLDEGLDVRSLEMDEAALGALDLLGRPDVMALLEEWGGGEALGTRTRVAVATSSALVAIVVPRAEPVWYVRAGMALEKFWLGVEREGLAAQPVSPVFLYVTNERELRELGGERHVRDLADLSRQFAELWDLADGEVVAMVMRVFDAPAPRVHSVRLALDEVLSRDETPTMEHDLSRVFDA